MKSLIGKCSFVFVLLFIAQVSHAEQAYLKLESKLKSKLRLHSVNSQVFDSAIYEELKLKYYGKKWLILLWSVDCPPCLKELALVQTIQLQQKQQQKSELPIVIINIDTFEGSASQRNKILANFDLTTQTNLHFSDGFEDHSRFMIDPLWFGELPRSYFIDEVGTFHGKSGLASKQLFEKWLTVAP